MLSCALSDPVSGLVRQLTFTAIDVIGGPGGHMPMQCEREV